MSNIKTHSHDMIDIHYGRLTVKAVVSIPGRKRRFLCLCECGRGYEAPGDSLTTGKLISCGCVRAEKAIKNSMSMATHRSTGTPEFRALHGARQRCLNSNSTGYRYWGGRGISVCDEWLGKKGFQNFIDHIGPMPTDGNRYTLDRVDVNGNYEPGNVRWATYKQQERNRRNNIFLTLGGVTKSLAELAEEHGLNYGTVKERFYRGWGSVDIFSAPGSLRHLRNKA